MEDLLESLRAEIVQRRVTAAQVVELYWFASYVYGEVSIEFGPDPFNGNPVGAFSATTMSNPGVPPDDIEEFGIAGFGTDGWNPCIGVPLTGACCVGETCMEDLSRDECRDEGGIYEGAFNLEV